MANKLFWISLLSLLLCYVYVANSASVSNTNSVTNSVSGSSSGSWTGSVTGSWSASSAATVSKSKKAAASKSKSKRAASKSKSKAAASKSKSRPAASKSKSRAAASKSKAAAASASSIVLPAVSGIINNCNSQPRVVCLSWKDPVLARLSYTGHEVYAKNLSAVNFIFVGNSGVFPYFRVEGLNPATAYTFQIVGIDGASKKQSLPATAVFTTAAVNTSDPLQNPSVSIAQLTCSTAAGPRLFTYMVNCAWMNGAVRPDLIKATIRCKANNPSSLRSGRTNVKDQSNLINGNVSWLVVAHGRTSRNAIVDLTCSVKVKSYQKNSQKVLRVANVLNANVAVKN